MLMQTDPFRDLDRLTEQVFGASRRSFMLMDAWREGDVVYAEFDLPGVDPSAIDIDVDRYVLTVRAERLTGLHGEPVAAERATGVFSRQLILGDNLDVDAVEAGYRNGVVQVRIPIAEEAKPRKIKIAVGGELGRKELPRLREAAYRIRDSLLRAIPARELAAGRTSARRPLRTGRNGSDRAVASG